MHLVVGLGNPGSPYEGTRHNIGFEVIDHLAQANRFDAPKLFKNAWVWRGRFGSEDVLLAQPQTFMNRSGDAVSAIARFYKIPTLNIVVLHDELDFMPGVVRLKPNGGAGGHNGLRSLISHLGRDFPRIRIGVGKPPNAAAGADYVLTRFDRASRVLMNEAVITASEAAHAIVATGLAAAMNRFNQR